MNIQQAFGTRAPGRSGRETAMRWRLFAPAISVIWIVGMIDKTGVGVIATDKGFLSAMGLSGRPATIGFLTTITLVFYGASMPVWGMLIDRFGPRRCALFGLVFWAVSTLVAGLAGNVGVLLAGRALLGVSEGFLWPLSNALTARWFPLSERARAKSIWLGAINLGFAVSGFVVLGAIEAISWRGAFFLLTGLALVLCIPAAWFFVHDDPETEPRVSAAELAHIRADVVPDTEQSQHAHLRRWSYWVIVLAWVTNNIGVFGLASWFPTYLKSEQGISGATAGAYIALAFVLCIVVAPFVGLGMDRTRRKAIWAVAGFGLAAVFLLLSRALPASLGFQLAAVIIAIVGIEGFTTLAGQGVLHSMVPAARMGRANGVMSGTGNFIGAFGSTIMGALIGAGGFGAAFVFLIAVFCVGAGCCLVLHRLKY